MVRGISLNRGKWRVRPLNSNGITIGYFKDYDVALWNLKNYYDTNGININISSGDKYKTGVSRCSNNLWRSVPNRNGGFVIGIFDNYRDAISALDDFYLKEDELKRNI